MKHATPGVLDELEDLLETVRALDGLVERKRGVFHRKSRAFLHFHEDPTGLFADVRLGGDDFERLRVSTAAERRRLARAIAQALGSG